ncbi:MFS transporter [Variovorax sp. J31P179]|uniref:MFS transporter n=1 Tax=Variovorax sp. J31P179 TaxID=3053508 RepID=UPI00257575C2|nr:MFS transporter [Variovorax sp. J31P179]MDM0084948.1 MFS transporter [Variovorax sp. J31P179]
MCIVFVALAIGGAAWMAVMATFNSATQSSSPPWVRSRAVALHTLSALGSFAIGSAFWGAVSGIAGLAIALSMAASRHGWRCVLARWLPLRMGASQEVTPVALWNDLLIKNQPLPGDGPVSVEICYCIRAGEADEFLNAVTQLRASRRRDGATLWRVYRDLGDPSRYIERFIVSSWAEYLHQRARATLADQEAEARIRVFLREGETVTTQALHRRALKRPIGAWLAKPPMPAPPPAGEGRRVGRRPPSRPPIVIPECARSYAFGNHGIKSWKARASFADHP